MIKLSKFFGKIMQKQKCKVTSTHQAVRSSRDQLF